MDRFPNSKGADSRKGSTSVISGTTGSGDLALGVERCEDRGVVGDTIGGGIAIVPDGEPKTLCEGARLGLVASTVGALDSRDVLGCRADSAFPPTSCVAEYDRCGRAATAY